VVVLFWPSPAIDVGNGRRIRQVQQVSRRLCPAARDGIQLSARRSATEFRRARRSAISDDAVNPDPQPDSAAAGQAAESLEESTARPEGETGSPPVMALPRHIDVALRSFGQPNSVARQYDFWNDSYEWRRVFAELVGTFLLVLAAVGGGMVNARFGGHAISGAALVVAPALMVMAVILFMGGVSGAHLNPAVSVAFALRGDFPWKRVPAYVVAQVVGGVVATLLLWALVGRQGAAGLTLPGSGISTVTAMIWEAVLTAGLVSVILGTASGAQQLGPIAALGVGSYIALAGLFGAPVSGASMNPARSLAPALVLGDWTSWWAYLAGPLLGAVIAVGIAYVLRGAGGGTFGTRAAQGTLGTLWIPGRAGPPASGAAPRS
jgi:aquaporin Z